MTETQDGGQGPSQGKPVNLDEKLAQFSEYWSPKRIGTLNDYEIKLVKIKDEFVWHSHADTDELFLVLDGELTIQLRQQPAVVLGPREMYVVPRGLEHCPKAEHEVTCLLIEPSGVRNTGDAGGALTATVETLS